MKYCATIWGEKCCTSKLLLSYFQDRQFFSMMHMCMITIFTGVFYLHDFKGRSLVENAWNGHQTIVWEDFRLFSTNDGYLWRRVYFLCKSSIMSILYRGTANLLVKSAVYAVILCIKGKIWNAEVRFDWQVMVIGKMWLFRMCCWVAKYFFTQKANLDKNIFWVVILMFAACFNVFLWVCHVYVYICW